MTWIASIGNGEQTVTIVKTCVVCGEIKSVHCSPEEFDAWLHGALIQVAMPNTPKEERELLVTGTCGECWKNMFDLGPEKEEDEEDEE